MRLKDKVAIVTGGSRGIGFATVKAFLKEGATVVLCASRQETADKAVQELKALYPNAVVEGITPNLSKLNDVRAAFKAVAEKYGKDRRTEIIYEEIEDYEEVEEVPDYPVHLFFTRDGYFKKITPLSLRMGGEQKLKEGDEIVSTVETTNRAELLFFTDKCQVYKSKASEFEDSKASVLGDFVPSKLGFEAEEKPLCMIVTTDYSGFMMFFFENGKAAKVKELI